uniref:Uncharacterized protein n=1 Tax=Hordeum vulgare subsp. vulgare TaxID=112509 RepID=A0A8I6XGJ2_HORVV
MRQCIWGYYSLASPGAWIAASTLGCCPTDTFATPLQPTLLSSTLWLSFTHYFDALPILAPRWLG